MFACARKLGVGGFERAAIMVKSAGGMERGFVVIVCRARLDPPCSKACRRALTLLKNLVLARAIFSLTIVVYPLNSNNIENQKGNEFGRS